MNAPSSRIDDPVSLRQVVEFRFTPHPGLLSHGGDVAAEFRRPPFVHWTIGTTPFRVEMRDEDRTKIAVLSVQNAILEMEVPDTFTVFRDSARRWIRTVCEVPLKDGLQFSRIGFRSWCNSPVIGMSYEGLVRMISDRFLKTDDLLGKIDGYHMTDNMVVVHFASADRKINLSLGPLSSEESREKNWVSTAIGQEKVPDLSLGIDVDVFEEIATPTNRSHQQLTVSMDSSKQLADKVSEAVTSILRG